MGTGSLEQDGGQASASLALRATRFSRGALEEAVLRQAGSLSLRCRLKDEEPTWLRQDFTVTVTGSPEAVNEFGVWVGFLREGAGDNPGPAH